MAASPSKTAGATASSVLITQLARGMRRRVEQAVAPLGLRPRELVVLHHLRERGPSAQQTLLELLGIDPSNLVAVLNDLEDAGLIVRSRDRSDRRRGIIQLSHQGEAVLDDVHRALHRIDDELLGTLTPAQRSTLNGLLARAAEGVALDCTQDATPDC